MITDIVSIVLSGLGLVQNAGSDKVQQEMVKSLESIRDILEKQASGADPSRLFVPDPLWLTWYNALQSDTIILVTGCHEFSEIFDRSAAYALKFAIDQFGAPFNHQPIHAMVMGDIWFHRDTKFTTRPFVVSVGGPNVNTVTHSITSKGNIIHRGNKWKITRDNKRYAVYGDDPVDTLYAMKAFAERELLKYLSSVWGRNQ